MRKAFSAISLVVALVATATALAATPTHETSVNSSSFIDDETCSFPIAVTLDRTRTTTTFENGDRQLHVRLIVTMSANGKTWTDRDAFNIFISAASPDTWEIVGAFTHTRATDNGTIFLESGRILYNVKTDTVTDAHAGPHGTGADPDTYDAAVCAALAP